MRLREPFFVRFNAPFLLGFDYAQPDKKKATQMDSLTIFSEE